MSNGGRSVGHTWICTIGCWSPAIWWCRKGLADPELAKRVSVRDGTTISSDGPFAEVKEYLAGFYLVECESIDRAVELAALVPDAWTGSVEVRPVFDLSVFDV